MKEYLGSPTGLELGLVNSCLEAENVVPIHTWTLDKYLPIGRDYPGFRSEPSYREICQDHMASWGQQG